MGYDGSAASAEALLFLLISLVVTWLIIYTAVRTAVGHALDRAVPGLVAQATATPEAVTFEISNLGTAPALDVALRWFVDPAEAELAHTQLIGANGRFEWTVEVAAVPDETLSPRKLEVDWARDTDPSMGRRSTSCAVLVPARLKPPVNPHDPVNPKAPAGPGTPA